MSYKLATAYIEILVKGVQAAETAISNVGKNLQGLTAGFTTLSSALGVGLSIGAAVAASRQFIHMANEAYATEARLRSILHSTGEAAGFNARQIMAFNKELAGTTAFSTGELNKAAGSLARFDKISGDTFKRVLSLAADVSQNGFGTVSGAATALGRALQNPANAARALRAAGVYLDEQQQKQLKSWVKMGQVLKAQAFILDEVAAKNKGAAEFFAKTPAGQWKQVQNEIADVGEELGKRLLPMAINMAKAFRDIGKSVLSIADAITVVTDAFGGWPAKVLAVVGIVAALVSGVGTIPALIVAGVAFARELGVAFQYVGEAIKQASMWATVFAQNWQQTLQAVLQGAMFLASYMFDLYRNNATYIWGYFAGRALRAFADVAEFLAKVFVQVFSSIGTALYNLIMAIPGWIAAALSGDFTTEAISKMFEAAFNEAMYQVQRLEEGFSDGFNKRNMGINFGMSDRTKKQLGEFNKAMDPLLKKKQELDEKMKGRFEMGDPEGPMGKGGGGRMKTEVELKLPSGLTSLPTAWSNLQEAILKQQTDPQEKTNELLGGIQEAADQELEIQAEMRDHLSKIATKEPLPVA